MNAKEREAMEREMREAVERMRNVVFFTAGGQQQGGVGSKPPEVDASLEKIKTDAILEVLASMQGTQIKAEMLPATVTALRQQEAYADGLEEKIESLTKTLSEQHTSLREAVNTVEAEKRKLIEKLSAQGQEVARLKREVLEKDEQIASLRKELTEAKLEEFFTAEPDVPVTPLAKPPEEVILDESVLAKPASVPCGCCGASTE